MRKGLLLNVLVGGILASGAIHPFAKYKNIAVGTSPTTSTPAASKLPLECFQVAEPVLTPSGVTRRDTTRPPAITPIDQQPISIGVELGGGHDDIEDGSSLSSCTVVLMEHTFASSYGHPYVGNYTPPPCSFDHVVINFTTLVKGRQYDRTGVMYLGDAEIWRTSTAEPTDYGIRWEWLKDMTAFLSLWKQPQTLIFDLENNVDSTYTGLINTTLTATFFSRKKLGVSNKYQPADLIIPISKRLSASGKPSQFVYPADSATNTVTDFPRNANRAVFTVDVKGQTNEEFWWSNVPQSAIYAFNATYGEYPGYSPFREAQVLVDGHLAGVSWPFPVIYTGGVVPQLNRPIVGIQAFDISEHEIDISPFLPLLCDGHDHSFAIKIVGLDDDGSSNATLSLTTDDEWYVTGKIFVWLDDADSVTTGNMGSMDLSQPTIVLAQTLTQDSTGRNETLEYNLDVSRSINLSSYVKTQRTEGNMSWSQSLSYSNTGAVSGYGNNNLNNFIISGIDTARGPKISYAKNYHYPLFCNSTAQTAPLGNLTLWAQLDQGLRVRVLGNTALPSGLEGFFVMDDSRSAVGSALSTWRNGTAQYYRPGDNSYSKGTGQTRQIFSFSAIHDGGKMSESYYRDVTAVADAIVADHVEVGGAIVRNSV
ncbi:peptide N-acetyl-beta-D-glucosaminyl asparaginase amidase A-domain-containing protein [Xylaria nigripes]|nr:peptide N-acetyl-beta-D-glucosaminyl asparaginase amidase A-domain-containing protein [Xylaria nigripes]